mmetsp:Transcript_90799/g.293130  ORF Transcript_90799/g.293130 Transcript_90799/m.293130 type:complete len:450 (-) Transcript_90799:419-1768(-)
MEAEALLSRIVASVCKGTCVGRLVVVKAHKAHLQRRRRRQPRSVGRHGGRRPRGGGGSDAGGTEGGGGEAVSLRHEPEGLAEVQQAHVALAPPPQHPGEKELSVNGGQEPIHKVAELADLRERTAVQGPPVVREGMEQVVDLRRRRPRRRRRRRRRQWQRRALEELGAQRRRRGRVPTGSGWRRRGRSGENAAGRPALQGRRRCHQRLRLRLRGGAPEVHGAPALLLQERLLHRAAPARSSAPRDARKERGGVEVEAAGDRGDALFKMAQRHEAGSLRDEPREDEICLGPCQASAEEAAIPTHRHEAPPIHAAPTLADECNKGLLRCAPARDGRRLLRHHFNLGSAPGPSGEGVRVTPFQRFPVEGVAVVVLPKLGQRQPPIVDRSHGPWLLNFRRRRSGRDRDRGRGRGRVSADATATAAAATAACTAAAAGAAAKEKFLLQSSTTQC